MKSFVFLAVFCVAGATICQGYTSSQRRPSNVTASGANRPSGSNTTASVLATNNGEQSNSTGRPNENSKKPAPVSNTGINRRPTGTNNVNNRRPAFNHTTRPTITGNRRPSGKPISNGNNGRKPTGNQTLPGGNNNRRPSNNQTIAGGKPPLDQSNSTASLGNNQTIVNNPRPDNQTVSGGIIGIENQNSTTVSNQTTTNSTVGDVSTNNFEPPFSAANQMNGGAATSNSVIGRIPGLDAKIVGDGKTTGKINAKNTRV